MKRCMFCQQELELHSKYEPENSANFYASDARHIYMCSSCSSQQDYSPEGELLDWGFHVGEYGLWFFPKYPLFTIKHYPDEDTVLGLNFLPKLTPQNTTIERIKLYLLFS